MCTCRANWAGRPILHSTTHLLLTIRLQLRWQRRHAYRCRITHPGMEIRAGNYPGITEVTSQKKYPKLPPIGQLPGNLAKKIIQLPSRVFTPQKYHGTYNIL